MTRDWWISRPSLSPVSQIFSECHQTHSILEHSYLYMYYLILRELLSTPSIYVNAVSTHFFHGVNALRGLVVCNGVAANSERFVCPASSMYVFLLLGWLWLKTIIREIRLFNNNSGHPPLFVSNNSIYLLLPRPSITLYGDGWTIFSTFISMIR